MPSICAPMTKSYFSSRCTQHWMTPTVLLFLLNGYCRCRYVTSFSPISIGRIRVTAPRKWERFTTPEVDKSSPDLSSLEDKGISAPETSQPTPPKEQREQQVRTDDTPSLSEMMKLLGTSPRRIFVSIGSAASIALASNFLGITSNLISSLPEEFSESTGLDSFYPRGEYKRVIVRSGATSTPGSVNSLCKCSFLIPKEWVADTGLALAQAQRRAKVLDYSMSSPSIGGGVLPDAAYGPPGRLDNRGLSNGDTNVSVIINNNVKNFSLKETLGGDPMTAAEVLLSSKFGPKRKITILSACEEQRGETNRTQVYQFEYLVNREDRGLPLLRAISVVAGSATGDAFITLTVVSLNLDWENPSTDMRLRQVANSFKLL